MIQPCVNTGSRVRHASIRVQWGARGARNRGPLGVDGAIVGLEGPVVAPVEYASPHPRADPTAHTAEAHPTGQTNTGV